VIVGFARSCNDVQWSGREYLLIRLKPGMHFHRAISYRLQQGCGQFAQHHHRLCNGWDRYCS